MTDDRPLPNGLTFRTEIRPGDLGMIVHQHGVVYAAEYGLDATFEPYVAMPLAEFCMPTPVSDAAAPVSPGRLWIADTNDGKFAGSIAICRTHRQREAQLRWFLVLPEARGSGLGPALLHAALDECRNEGLHDVFLWTFDELHAARALYARAGFVETTRSTHDQWGKSITQVRMELKIV